MALRCFPRVYTEVEPHSSASRQPRPLHLVGAVAAGLGPLLGSLADGLSKTYAWIKGEVAAEAASGFNISVYASSKVVIQVTDTLDSLAGSK